MNYVAFDLGASSGKLYLGTFDGDHLAIQSAHHFANGPVTFGNALYWNFIGIYQQMKEGIARANRMTDGGIASFGVDSFCNDFAFIDKHGALLSPMHCYRDERTARCRDAIYAKMPPEELYMKSGNQISLFSAAMQLASMREEQHDALMDTADKLVFLPDLLNYYITGNAVTEYTIATVSQLYDYDKDDWSHEILERFRIPAQLFSPIAQPASRIGLATDAFASELSVNPFEVVTVCEHDTASAYLAALHEGDGAIISSGTWMLVGTESDRTIINEYGYKNNIANEGSCPGHHRLLCNVMGNWLFQELQREYALAGSTYTFADLERLASEVKPFQWQINVDDECFFSPGGILEKIRGRCIERHSSAPESAGEFARCIYESLAFKCVYAVEKLEGLKGKILPVISVIGGGSRDRLISAMLANTSGKPVIAGPQDASALGNLMVQMLAMGNIASIGQGKDLLRKSFAPQCYEPQNTDVWQDVYLEYKKYYGLRLG